MRLRFAAVALLLLVVPSRGRAEEDSPVRATIVCAHAIEPGRVRCDVEARSTGTGVLRWGDVEIIDTPAFAVPLRGRIGPREAIGKEPPSFHWALALVAKRTGAGDVHARVRVVHCKGGDGEGTCTPYVVSVTASLVVGP